MTCTSVFKEKINNDLSSSLEQLEIWSEIEKCDPDVAALLRRHLLTPGKRVRPILFKLSFQGYGGICSKPIDDVAMALELLHMFILIHDDIIDHAETRRNLPSLHRSFDSQGKSRVGGNDFALVVGDMIYALAINIMTHCDLRSELKEKCLKHLSETALDTGKGQLKEMVLTAKPLGEIKQCDILEIYRLKTARYTLGFPLALGATLAEAGEEQCRVWNAIGDLLGEAYQLVNDIDELRSWNGTGKIPQDLMERKKTLPVFWLYESASDQERREMDAIFESSKITAEDVNKLVRSMEKAGIFEKAAEFVSNARYDAKEKSKSLSISADIMKEIVDFIDQAIHFTA